MVNKQWGSPETVDCPNCLRNMFVKGHLGKPSAGVDQKAIHREWLPIGSASPAFTFHCPNCGHYTTFEPDESRP